MREKKQASEKARSTRMCEDPIPRESTRITFSSEGLQTSLTQMMHGVRGLWLHVKQECPPAQSNYFQTWLQEASDEGMQFEFLSVVSGWLRAWQDLRDPRVGDPTQSLNDVIEKLLASGDMPHGSDVNALAHGQKEIH